MVFFPGATFGKDEVPTEGVEQRMKAMIQSYYSRVENKDYIVHDSIPGDTTF